MLKKIRKEIKKLADPEKAKILQGFFKTGDGEYGEGDIFLGISVPKQRELIKNFWEKLDSISLQKLLNSKIHEERLISLLILIEKYEKSDEKVRKKIFDFYLRNSKHVNNWDLVDLSAPKIVGDFLADKSRKILYKLAKSDNLWERRIAVVSCFSFIRKNDFEDILKISKILLRDSHDLIHKAVGWMLREVGKGDERVLKDFLNEHYKEMPRTMLRYAIERFGEGERRKYLLGDLA